MHCSTIRSFSGFRKENRKHTASDSTPFSFSVRTVVRLSTVFLANRLTLFVTMRSIFPARASATIALKPSRRLVLVAEIPSSV